MVLIHLKRKHQITLSQIYTKPISANIKWKDIEALFLELGAEIEEREGSQIAVVLFGQVKVFHRPHPSPDTDKGAVASVKKWLSENGVIPYA
ncbi:HicA-related protein [Mannheimia varigena USDA-ARS-USMARC-1296]|uniref:HicA-related protein n=1 Tax=Mannheimia varigena USDA-ARS-USMARC-1296 TaxID=1433287 RepID=W0Q9U1_9PAST|nr:type II toxin-antitoxin system HicA family toxin [Mannheimia varigena]AHG75067.1 HicA-related protein [Mannheimia varigena USDA-ARS-USMARC-1296]